MTYLALSTLDLASLTLGTALAVLGSALAFGIVLTAVYAFTHRRTGFDRSFGTTILLLPVLISIVILLVADNVGRAISLAGIFAIIRFRITLRDTKDIMYVMATVGLGVCAGSGYVSYGFIASGFLSVILLALHFAHFDRESDDFARLKIVIPESLNYTHAFDVVFQKYLSTERLTRVKTTDFGTTFELTYDVRFRSDVNQKKFLDDLRVKNGNLNVSLSTGFVERVAD